jgi:hypothetical protein
MCNRFSYEHGYICDECYDELTQLAHNHETEFFGSPNWFITKFMLKCKDRTPSKTGEILENYLNDLFRTD